MLIDVSDETIPRARYEIAIHKFCYDDPAFMKDHLDLRIRRPIRHVHDARAQRNLAFIINLHQPGATGHECPCIIGQLWARRLCWWIGRPRDDGRSKSYGQNTDPKHGVSYRNINQPSRNSPTSAA